MKPKNNRHQERSIKVFPPRPSMILASRKTYQKTSSNGLDLAELGPKPVDHRQKPIDPAYAIRLLTFFANGEYELD
jgi:hypothetical protein